MITKNRNIEVSSMYIGFLILSEIKKQEINKMSIYDAYTILKKNNITSSRQLILGLSFLYSVDIIEFEEAYLWIKK